MIELEWDLVGDPRRKLPPGHLRVVGILSNRPHVELIHIGLPDREQPAARSISFDSDRVVIDYAKDGGIIGFEFLVRSAPSELPGYQRAASGDPLMRIAFETAMFTWDLTERALRLAADLARKKLSDDPMSVKRVVAKSLADDESWREPFLATT